MKPVPNICRKKPGKKRRDKKIGKLIVTFHFVIALSKFDSFKNSFFSWSSVTKGLNIGAKAPKITSAKTISLTAML